MVSIPGEAIQKKTKKPGGQNHSIIVSNDEAIWLLRDPLPANSLSCNYCRLA